MKVGLGPSAAIWPATSAAISPAAGSLPIGYLVVISRAVAALTWARGDQLRPW
jgi:hypothetical protein